MTEIKIPDLTSTIKEAIDSMKNPKLLLLHLPKDKQYLLRNSGRLERIRTYGDITKIVGRHKDDEHVLYHLLRQQEQETRMEGHELVIITRSLSDFLIDVKAYEWLLSMRNSENVSILTYHYGRETLETRGRIIQGRQRKHVKKSI